MRKAWRAWLMLCALFVCGYAYGAGRVFYDSAEADADPITHGWSPDSPNGTCSYVTSGADGTSPHGGSKMIRCNFSNVSSNAFDTLKIGTSSYTDEFFYRVYVRLDTNFNQSGSGAQKILRHFQTDPYHDHFAVVGPSDAGWKDQCNPNDSTACPTKYEGDCLDVTGAWHKYEFYLRQSTGTIKVWCDGSLVRNDTGMDFVSTKWNTFYLTSNGDTGGSDATNYEYFDDFELYTDQGSGATGSMSDATIAQGGGSPPVVSGISCSPTIIQSHGTTDCTATASNSPTSYSWSVSSCSLATCSTSDTDSVATFTCQYGGPCDTCVIASNADGASSQYCTSSAYLHVKVRKGGSITVH